MLALRIIGTVLALSMAAGPAYASYDLARQRISSGWAPGDRVMITAPLIGGAVIIGIIWTV